MNKKGSIRALTAFIDHCCFNLSIVIARLQIDQNNVNEQWSVDMLCRKLNGLSFTESSNFYVNSIVLSHGLLLFQKTLKYFGMDAVQIFQEEKSVIEYNCQPYSRMSIEFKCGSFTTPLTDKNDLLLHILATRNLILKKLNYEKSNWSSASEVFGVLFLHMAVSDIPDKYESPEKVPESYNLRKSPQSLSFRSISNVSNKIISSVDEKVGIENSLFFLKSAVKVLHKKRKRDIIESASDDNEEIDSVDDFEKTIINNDRVQKALKELPKKNVTINKKDKVAILNLLDVTKKMVETKTNYNSDRIATKITKKILAKLPSYRHIKKKELNRWCSKRMKKVVKSGRKVNEEFESQVWGNLLLCVFEDKKEEASEKVLF